MARAWTGPASAVAVVYTGIDFAAGNRAWVSSAAPSAQLFGSQSVAETQASTCRRFDHQRDHLRDGQWRSTRDLSGGAKALTCANAFQRTCMDPLYGIGNHVLH
jgi:hypothetical protein